MKKFLIILFMAFNCYAQTEDLPNSCLINSIIAYEDIRRSFEEKDVWGNILVYKFKDPRNPREIIAHAVSVFNWNKKYYVYDINQGSYELNTQDSNIKNNPLRAARLIERKYRVLDAEYLIKN